MSDLKQDVISFFQRLAASRRYALIPDWRLASLPLATHLKSLFALHGVETVIDVGANRGQYRDFLRDEVGFNGRIHSFEPLSHLRQVLDKRAEQDSLWHIHHYALGAEATRLEIQVMASDTFSSLRQISQESPEVFRSSTVVTKTEEVEVRRPDDFASDLAGVTNSTVYLKVDTQGFDTEVLKGAGNLLRQISGLQFELPIQRIYQDVPQYHDILTHIESLGFAISGLFPISVDESLRAVEFDCVMVPSLPA
jgi:FkbM family methyltransferase